MPFTLEIQGLRELDKALRDVDKAADRRLREAIRGAIEPVRVGAEQLALQNISHIGPDWSRVKVGVTSQYAYIAPARRRRGGSPRPKLGGLLVKKALVPAVKEHQDEVVAGVEIVLDRLVSQKGL